ncbi:MAG: hypothetical protein IH624_06985 [Phycisphaerae bacterium]|nr:hypothetical protein [Phycisphaerae bacterium]
MQKKCIFLAVVVLSTVYGRAAGQRPLDRAEILDLLKVLTDEPRDTWISSGVVHATRLEYRAATDQITESTVQIRYDGHKFYWEIDTDSASLPPDAQQGNPREVADMKLNARRVFAWDGQRYTVYSKQGNNAIVFEDTSTIPVVVNGPLTAGVIPWGYGKFTYDVLSGAEVSGIETQREGLTIIELTVRMTETLQMTCVLDRDKDYAVLSNTVRNEGRSLTVRTYDGYRRVGGRWVPQVVQIETFDDSGKPARLTSYDHWNLTRVSTQIPTSNPFVVDMEPEAFIEEYTKLSKKPLTYYQREHADTESLRRMRLEIIAAGKGRNANCGTITTQYVMSRWKKNITQQQRTLLGESDDASTSLYTIKQVLAGAGLNCRAVKTDIDTLRTLRNCSVILHLPGRNHFVVLDHIDDQRVWLVDLDHDRFYFPVGIDLFTLDWPSGTALLVSAEPLPLSAESVEIPDARLRKLVGADSLGTYSCTQRIQEYRIVYCSPAIGMVCAGRYRVYPELFGCELSEGGGGCAGGPVAGSWYLDCIEKPSDPGECGVTGEWIVLYIHACK